MKTKLLNKTAKFNLMEIILTIAIVGVSLTCITPLFFRGFQDNKVAVSDSYSARASQNIYAHIARDAKENVLGKYTPGKTSWESYFTAESPIIPVDKPTGFELNSDSEFGAKAELGNLYEVNGAKSGVFGIMAKTGDNNDIKGEVRIWQAAVSKVFRDKETIVSSANSAKLDDNIKGLNIESAKRSWYE
jgi:hypothetical protein